MKKQNLLFVVFDIILIVWLILYPNNDLTAIVFVSSLMINDVFTMHLVKYGVGKFSRVVSDVFKYFFMITFSVAFWFMYFMTLLKGLSFMESASTLWTIVGGISLISLAYYFPAYISAGRYRMYRIYDRKGFFDAVEESLKYSIKFALTRDYLVFVATFYGGFGMLSLIGSALPDYLYSALTMGYMFFIYVAFPLMVERIELKKKKK